MGCCADLIRVLLDVGGEAFEEISNLGRRSTSQFGKRADGCIERLFDVGPSADRKLLRQGFGGRRVESVKAARAVGFSPLAG